MADNDEAKKNNKSMESVYAMAMVADMDEALEEIAAKLNISKRTAVGLAISRMYLEVMQDPATAGEYRKYGYLMDDGDKKIAN